MNSSSGRKVKSSGGVVGDQDCVSVCVCVVCVSVCVFCVCVCVCGVWVLCGSSRRCV
jgi:hypothetical protein